MRTFQTRVGGWYWALIIVCSCLLFVFFWIHQLLLAVLFAVIVIYEIEMLIHTHYVLTTEGKLHVCSGRFAKEVIISIDCILSIQRVKSFIFAPALSFHRLKIVYKNKEGKAFTFVSPRNPDDFIAALLKKNPSIAVVR
ncbi:MAG TPA: PH domain-containing protein [Candidatus Phocaeicola gallistercoris]|nr:PH domain-containing protein [Candidatus Phocaeicola gallistercoris]